MDYLVEYASHLDVERIRTLRYERRKILRRPFANRLQALLDRTPAKPAHFRRLDQPCVTIGATTELSLLEREALHEMLVALIPWRKGPFRFFGFEIDAEWRSDIKWGRIVTLGAPQIRGRRILDIGANNLYYLYRIAAQKPEFALGIDPMVRYHFHAELHRRFTPDLPLSFEMFGVDDLDGFRGFFDTVFCLGIIYHRRNPMELLEQIAATMRPKGELYLESIVLPGTGSSLLLPEDRYMKAKGYWFLPTAPALVNMVRRGPFTDVELLYDEPLTRHEQRRTEWSMYESLEHFLDPCDPTKTVEGHPAPRRACVKAIGR